MYQPLCIAESLSPGHRKNIGSLQSVGSNIDHYIYRGENALSKVFDSKDELEAPGQQTHQVSSMSNKHVLSFGTGTERTPGKALRMSPQ